jgi:eukaryotic-like serine/threonine-protein kinase
VHRDIKPANILMDNRHPERVYLCDFGLGRDLDVATSQQMRDGAGTPLYMAPERLLRLPADEIKCDIYSMGVTLCEALTLKRPFQVPGDLPPPALAPFLARTAPLHPHALDPELPAELAAVIMKAMARNPEERHDCARELAADLDRAASAQSFSCRTSTVHHPARPNVSHAHILARPVTARFDRVTRYRASAIRSGVGAASRANPISDFEAC